MFEMSLINWLPLLPVFSVSVFSLIPFILKTVNKNKEPSSSLVLTVHLLGWITSLVLFLLLGFKNQEIFSLKFDVYGTGACVLVALAAFQALPLFRLNPYIDKTQFTEILFLFSNGGVGLFIFSLSQDWMTAFIGLEITSLVLYMTIGMGRKEFLSLEAAMKYFLLSSFAGVLFLYGFSFLFGAGGSSQLISLQEMASSQYNRFFFIGLTLILTALFFKMAVFPFQFWLTEVYQGALTPLTSFMATAVKTAVVLFIGKIFSYSLPFSQGTHGGYFISALSVLSVLTVLFGNLMALKQHHIKRWLAFSSIAHSGYLMMGLLGILELADKDFRPIFYYLLAYIFMTGGILTGVQLLEKNSSQVEMKDLKGLFKQQPFLAICLAIFLLSLAGLPPTFGFFSKVALFQPLILSQNYFLIFWALMGSALGIYYYIKPLLWMVKEGQPQVIPSLLGRAFLVFSTCGILFGAFIFGFFFH